jgi:hypothetical protein
MEQNRDTDAEALPQEGGRSVITTRRHVRTITTAGHITTGHVADDEEEYEDTNHQVTAKWHSHEFSLFYSVFCECEMNITFPFLLHIHLKYYLSEENT